jgi:hypothetical protein
MSFNPISGYNPPDPDPAARIPTRTTRRLLLAADEDDAYAWMTRHGYPIPDGIDMVVWPSRFHTLDRSAPFDRLAVTARASHMDAAVAACLTRVKGPDGLTPGQRLSADEVGARLRGAS